MTIADMQRRLQALGHDPGPADGIGGPRTAAALEAALAGLGLPMTVTATQDKLTATGPVVPPAVLKPATQDLPWMIEGRSVLGLHEVHDNARLKAWLKSDGRTLGDPASLPWCGDFVETCIQNTLPDEPFPGPLEENPYWARHWAVFGRPTELTYGAILVFVRDGGGHVGFAVGQDADHYHVLGGNQSNAVSIARIAKSRLLASRWPSTAPERPIALPKRSGKGTITRNEA